MIRVPYIFSSQLFGAVRTSLASRALATEFAPILGSGQKSSRLVQAVDSR
jgi:hypothetical protein